jgi:hypothetical protein
MTRQPGGSSVTAVMRGASPAGTDVTRRRPRLIAIVAVCAVLASIIVGTVGLTLALFTAHTEPQAVFGTKALFPGERVTPAFQVGDSSGGSQVDRSSPFAAAADGLTATTSAWSNAFASNRYVEFDVNDSLGSGVAVTSATFDFRIASSGAGEACFYLEVRRISTGAVLETHGSIGSPAGCVTGTTSTLFSTAISAVATTSIANDLRVRVFGRESGDAAIVIDQATVAGSTAYQAFTLYPVMFRDAADTTPEVVPWGLALP